MIKIILNAVAEGFIILIIKNLKAKTQYHFHIKIFPMHNKNSYNMPIMTDPYKDIRVPRVERKKYLEEKGSGKPPPPKKTLSIIFWKYRSHVKISSKIESL
jgi:hypothetical protein